MLTLCSSPPPLPTVRELGRARAEKYMVKYIFREVVTKGMAGYEPLQILKYQPVYGPVPGYQEVRRAA